MQLDNKKPRTQRGFFMSRDGQYSARSQEGGAVMSRDGRAENCSLHFPHSPRPCGSYSARSQDGGAVMSRDGRAENCSLHFPHFPLPCGSFCARSQEGGADVW